MPKDKSAAAPNVLISTCNACGVAFEHKLVDRSAAPAVSPGVSSQTVVCLHSSDPDANEDVVCITMDDGTRLPPMTLAVAKDIRATLDRGIVDLESRATSRGSIPR